METIHEPSDGVNQKSGVRRREFIRLGAIGGAAVAAGAVASTWAPQLRQRGLLSADGCVRRGVDRVGERPVRRGVPDEPVDSEPVQRRVAGSPGAAARAVRGLDELAERAGSGGWLARTRTATTGTSGGATTRSVGGATTPLVYKIELKVEEHSFTSSKVLPINSGGLPRDSFDQYGKRVAAGPRYLPPSTIYGFNGTFPGPMINAEYGKPALVRFVNKPR